MRSELVMKSTAKPLPAATNPPRRVLMALGYYDPQLHRGITRYAREAGWVLDTSMAHYGALPAHWRGDGVIGIEADAETGDLVVEPSAFSSRPGVRACRWVMKGLRRETRLTAPLYQGVSLPLDDTLIRNTRWAWPRK